MRKLLDIIRFAEAPEQGNADWANFLFHLGYMLSLKKVKDAEILLVLPILDLAAPLIAFGYLYGKINGTSCNQLTIDFFRNLEPGSDLLFNQNGKVIKAEYQGIVSFLNMECVKVKTAEKGNTHHIVPPQKFGDISVLSERAQENSVKLGKEVGGISEFARVIYGSSNTSNIANYLNCLWLVGKFRNFENELLNIQIKTKQSDLLGNFNELLLNKELLNAGSPSFSGFHSFYRDPAEKISSDLIIFKEGASYLRQCHNHIGNKITILDFSDPNLENTISLYNQKYYSRTKDLEIDLEFIPDNIICAAFIKESIHAS